MTLMYLQWYSQKRCLQIKWIDINNLLIENWLLSTVVSLEIGIRISASKQWQKLLKLNTFKRRKIIISSHIINQMKVVNKEWIGPPQIEAHLKWKRKSFKTLLSSFFLLFHRFKGLAILLFYANMSYKNSIQEIPQRFVWNI